MDTPRMRTFRRNPGAGSRYQTLEFPASVPS